MELNPDSPAGIRIQHRLFDEALGVEGQEDEEEADAELEHIPGRRTDAEA